MEELSKYLKDKFGVDTSNGMVCNWLAILTTAVIWLKYWISVSLDNLCLFLDMRSVFSDWIIQSLF